MNNPFYGQKRPTPRRPINNFSTGCFNSHQNRNLLDFTDNFSDYQPDAMQSDLHNSTMHLRSQMMSRSSNAADFQAPGSSMSEKPSFSSLFSSALNLNNNNNNSVKLQKIPEMQSLHSFSESMLDDDGVYLQISNLDQYYDETHLRHYLMNQLKPITPILSLTIETPSIAKIKVPSVQFAKQVISHLHRKKMGHKRIFVSFLKDKTSAECSALRNKVIGLLRDVPSHQLPMSKFRELFQTRFKSSISIIDLYRMPDVCTITVNNNDEKIISLQLDASQVNVEVGMMKQHREPYCIFHYKPDENKGWAEIEIEPLPNVYMPLSQVQQIVHELLKRHDGDIPMASILYCIEEEFKCNIQPDERGVNLEHLISCVSKVHIRNNDYGIKILAWRDNHALDEVKSWRSGNGKATNLSNGDVADSISKEVVELIRSCPKSTMQFSKFIPAYHNLYGKQCRVADYGCTKLIEMFEAMSSVVQVLGEGEARLITLTHQTQLRHFSADIAKVLRSQASKSICVSMLPQAYKSVHARPLDVTNYGVCSIKDLLEGLRNNSSYINISKLQDNDDYMLSLQKSRQSGAQIEKTSIFAGEVVELLRNEPQFSIQFRKFVRSYHYMFGSQCKLNDYGFMRLAELLEALCGIVEMDKTNEESRKVYLSRKVALRIFSEQITEIIKKTAGSATGITVKVDELLEFHKSQCGYQMQGSTLGYDTVLDAFKYVPFIELNSYDNGLWLVSHLENEKFRQRAMLACLTIIDIGVKVSLSKFHIVFHEKFKFNIHEKTLHAMKHAVEVEMVNGIKMISLSQTMKFLYQICTYLEQRRVVTIQDLKSHLKLHYTTCFKFGYPNLSSLLQAYPDIVRGTQQGDLHERSEIELAPECPFYPAGLKKLLAKNQVQAYEDKPKMHQLMPNRYDNKNEEYLSNYNPFMGGDDNSMCITMPTGAFQHFNNNAFSNHQEGFYERNIRFQQSQMQQQKRDHWNSTGGSSGFGSTNSSYSSFDLGNCQHPFSMMQYREPPPKPDTPPPSKPSAIWFDPTWKCDNGLLGFSKAANLGNSSSDTSLKSFNVHVVSPFMSFKTQFTFDNINPSNSGANINHMQNM